MSAVPKQHHGVVAEVEQLRERFNQHCQPPTDGSLDSVRLGWCWALLELIARLDYQAAWLGQRERQTAPDAIDASTTTGKDDTP